MRRDEVIAEGARLMTVCNSCRYCEQYCVVFPAVSRRLTFTAADIDYLASLCHNCGECLYACQYAPPHQFAINVPQALARARVETYQAYCWPQPLATAFRRHNVATALFLAIAFTVVLAGGTWARQPDALTLARRSGDFYAVMPHGVMVTIFGGVGLFVLLASAISMRRFWRAMHGGAPPRLRAVVGGLRQALTLRNLHASGSDCTSQEEQRTPWRRWFHHCTFYGFLLCFASTGVAAVYHTFLGSPAPYPLTSAPVVLGTVGGLGLVVGPAGLLWQRRRRDEAVMDAEQRGLDESFILLLALTSVTGLLLLALRDSGMMAPLLMVHLGTVLALFVTLPYGKFMHGLYRAAALVKSCAERDGTARV